MHCVTAPYAQNALSNSILTCLAEWKVAPACVFMPVCQSECVAPFFLCEVRMTERRGMHLHYHLFWPPVTETIWTRCQNLIREWKRPGGGGMKEDWNKEFCHFRMRRQRGRQKQRVVIYSDKGAAGAKRKVEVKQCEMWHFPTRGIGQFSTTLTCS